MLAIRGGDEAALDVLIERKAKPLMQLAYRIVGDREDARDIVQLTFVRAWEKRESFDERWSVNTWIYRIATNLAIDLVRSQQSRQRQAEPVRHHLFEVVRQRQDRDLARLGRREVRRILHELASQLSDKQRLVFLLREVEGLSSREVGEIVGCRESTVRNHLFTARKHLRRELRRRYPEYGHADDAEPDGGGAE